MAHKRNRSTNKLSGLKRIDDILALHFKLIPMGGQPKQLLGDIAEGTQVLLKGFKGGGKSTFALQCAMELAKHGKVIYVAMEEQFGPTMQNKLKRFNSLAQGVIRKNLIFSDEPVGESEIKDCIAVFIDSIQMLDAFTVKTIRLMKEKYTKTAFFYISQVSQQGTTKSRSSSAIEHEVDVIVHFPKRKAGEPAVAETEKNRYADLTSIEIQFEDKKGSQNPQHSKGQHKKDERETPPPRLNGQ